MTTQATVSGGTLFEVALATLGDATQAWRIASASGMEDFWVDAAAVVRVPDVDPSQADGVPPENAA